MMDRGCAIYVSSFIVRNLHLESTSHEMRVGRSSAKLPNAKVKDISISVRQTDFYFLF